MSRRSAARAGPAAADGAERPLPKRVTGAAAAAVDAAAAAVVAADVAAGSAAPVVDVADAERPDDMAEARALMREYADTLGIDLCFQGFDAELATLPGEYAAARGGRLLLARVDGAPAGCVGLRALPEADDGNACEMKRLYVRPAFRRFGLGRVLAERLLDAARQAGYSSMLLDTLDEMEAARGLYRSLGFVEVPPYYFNPIAGAHYLRVDLGPGAAARL